MNVTNKDAMKTPVNSEIKNKRVLRSMATRELLLQAAQKLFISNGYHGTTVTAITDSIEMAYGTFYVHFKNKDDIFMHVFDDILNELQTIVDWPSARPTCVDDVREITGNQFIRIFGLVLNQQSLWTIFQDAIKNSPVVESFWKEKIVHNMISIIENQLQNTQNLGLSKSLDHQIVAKSLVYMGIDFMWEFVNGAYHESDIDHIAQTLVDFYISGAYLPQN
jgi:hypothetical protein